ncbi:TPA: hypothetical protein ACSPTT_001377, partial [Streptococcus pneumoniae]
NLPSNITQSKGFKIHLSASILNANLVAKKFFDFIFSREKKINFKILVSIKELSLQNTGLMLLMANQLMAICQELVWRLQSWQLLLF